MFWLFYVILKVYFCFLVLKVNCDDKISQNGSGRGSNTNDDSTSTLTIGFTVAHGNLETLNETPENVLMVNFGQNTSINCTASGSSGLSINWMKTQESNLTNVKGNFVNYNNTTAIYNLQFTNISASNGGDYLCEASNENVNAEKTLTIQVRPTVIISEARDTTIRDEIVNATAGGAVRINCAVDGYPKPPIGVWTRQSENSINESFISSNIRGNISRLRIESIQPSDRGVYTCTATNEAGEYQESVIINVGPRITLSGNGSTLIRNGIINATAGNTVTVNCAVDGYPEPLPGNWTRQNGVSINTNFLSNLSQDFSRLSIANIQASDGGVYICSSSSVVGENDMQVTVQVIPTTVTNTSQINFDGRENVKIFCSSSGFPRPNVTLTKITSGTTIEPSNSTSTNYLQSNNYEINNIEGDVGGEYICKGENQAGQTNTTITLQVRPTITLSKSPNNLIRAGVINAIPGNTVTVVCASNGYPKPPPGIWTRQNGDSINEDFLSNTSQGFSRLTINNIQPSDGDVYTCTARTEIGDSKKNVTINVRATITLTGDQSTIIRNGIINAIPGNTVTVVCASNGYPEPPPGIWTRQNGGSINEDLLSTTSEGFSRLTINNIQPNDGGVYICTTTNIVGDHQESVTINVRPAITISVRGRTMFRNGIVRATVNDTFVIVCDADGFPTPSKNWTRIIDSRIENVRFTMVQGSIRRRINNIQARDGGVYVCTAMNDAGSVQDQVTIQILPTISTGSDSYIFRYNRRGEISCSSAGFPTPSVTWIRNDVELQTLSSQNIYTIDMVRGDDGGEYICKAENGAGQINTSIIVEVSPKASVPETIQATLNREVTVNCNVDGFPTPNITWLKDGSQLSPTDQILITPSGVTSSTLRISNVQPSNLGEYVCEASNSVGNNSDEVTIRAFPIVTLTETIINTNRSQQVSVGCSASGFPSPSISWSRANGNLPGRANITKGLHSATLVISSIRLRDGGVYICTAENAAGTREANVTIRVSPSVSLSPESDYVNSPTQRSVNCTANGFPTPSITWKRNNGNSVLPSRLTPVEMGREVEVSLNIFDFEAVDGGDYVCTARNAAGQDTQTVTIRVEPSIMDEPTLHNFTPGNDETLVCTATGFPTPNISWRKLKNSFSNRVDITYSNQSLTSTGTLMINQIRASDGGSYVCEAENAVRKIDRTIQVQVSPAIVVSMTALILDEGDNMTVVCTANGFPRPTIVWSKVDQRNLSSRVTIRPVQMVNETAVSRRIRFRNVTYDNRGEYRCSASNFMTVSEIVLVNVTVNSTINLSAETIIVDRNRPEDDFNVRCTATGAPPIEIRWERNGEIVYTNRIERNSKDTSMNSNRVTQTIIGNNSSKEVQSILSVSSALYEDIGEYICRTRYNSTSISVNVTGPPVLLPTTQFIEEVSVDQSSVTFNCTFDGYPTPTISWYFYNGTELPQTSQFQINTPTMIKPYRISRTLTVYGLGCRGLFLYNYTCSATNGEESQPVPSGNFTVRINTTTLLVGTELMNCSQSEKFCLEHGQRLASITSINTLDDIFNEYHGADGRTVDRRNRTFFWISRMSGIHLQGIFNVSIQNCTLVRYGPAVAQQYLPQMQVDLPAYPICEEYRIQPNISKIPSTQEQCNGTYLQINWDYLPGSENLYHQIFLNDTLSQISPPNTNTVIITNLQPRTPYNIQVKPSFVGCENELPYFPNIFITGRGPLNPPNILDVNYNDETESCEVSWDPGQGSKGRDLEIGQYRVNISGLQRFGNPNEIEMERPTFVNISTMEDLSYNFSTRPNTIYNVSVGAVPSSPCVGILPKVLSNPMTGNCTTAVKAPLEIPLSSTLPQIVNNEVVLTLEPVSQRNGPVNCIFVIVQKIINEEIPKIIEDPSLINPEETERGYIAFAYLSFSDQLPVSLGNGRRSCCDVTASGSSANCTGNTRNKRAASNQLTGVNRPLEQNANYTYNMISSTRTDNGPIYASSIQSKPFKADITPTSDSTGIIIAIMVIIILIIIIVLISCFYCYKRKIGFFKEKVIEEVQTDMDNVPMTNIPASNITSAEDHIYEPLNTIAVSTSHFTEYNIEAKQLLKTYKTKCRNGRQLFEEEFKTTLIAVVKGTNVDVTISRMKENIPKNRFKNILPINDYRVVLNTTEEFPSDYINASYIDGYSQTAKFIAAQGPKKTTVNDFWRMVVENQCAVIVMVTKTVENKREKCEKYWPDPGEQRQCNHIIIHGISLVSYGEFHCTSLRVDNTADGTSIDVIHYQYLNWPDHGIPSTTTGLLRLYKTACQSVPERSGPMVVHCSAGVGRTGTFIALDILNEQLANENQINVFETVYNMRMKRTEMVQSLEQYIYIHKLLTEIYLLQTTDVDVSQFISHEEDLRRSRQTKSSKTITGIEYQFSLLNRIPSSFHSTETASKPANIVMNNVPEVLPYDHNLAFVSMTSNDSELPYVNASVIHAYENNTYFISAQDPIPQNIYLFWRCIIDNAIKCIIMIEDEENTEKYWADKDVLITYGDVSVRTTNEVDYSDYIQRDMEIYKENETTPYKVAQIAISGWGKTTTPFVSSVLQVVSILERCCADAETESIKKRKFIALIHCRDGSTQSGALCAIFNLIERVKTENMVDVFRAAKDVRDLRMGAISTLEQYDLCYKAVSSFIQSFELYGNFQ